MTKLEWSAAGTKIFEAGVDRGVLYVTGLPGVSWSGITSVSESPTGGQVTGYYIDGIKYLDDVSREEYEATITAYTYPEVFDSCIGVVEYINGLFATQQAKKTFGFSYRSRIGDDIQGIDLGYKLHLVYNATAEPAATARNSIAESINPEEFSWHISTTPEMVPGIVPTSHFIIDSRETPSALLDRIETILYGDDINEPRMPEVDEMMYLFRQYSADIYDAGHLTDPYFETFDGGTVPHRTDTLIGSIDGGGA